MRDFLQHNLRQYVVGDEFEGQRLDNYLLREWRGVPRSLVYRLIRNGHVRVNAARIRPCCRLHSGDRLQLPVSVKIPAKPPAPAAKPLELSVLYEDSALLAVDKPAGLAVHGGSGVAHGVIERLRSGLKHRTFLELAHRLDRETSGVLLLAKKRTMLAAIQEQWRAHRVQKRYIAMVLGCWRRETHQDIALPLKRIAASDGARQVVVSDSGKTARTKTWLIHQHPRNALIGCTLQTGRTHQLRVHFAALDIPIIGDKKYGDFDVNRLLGKDQRMFLHAQRLTLTHPRTNEPLTIESPIPACFDEVTQALNNAFPK